MDFWDIYHKHNEPVRKFILALVKDQWVADDLVQETFIRVQKNLNQVRETSKLTSWIYKIARNLCQDHFRKISRLSKREDVLTEKKEIFSEPLFLKTLEQHQMGECVQDKIRLLPESYQTALVLFDLMEFSHQEIADVLDISVENVKVRLHRARKKLKTILKKECTFEVDERSVLVCEPVDRKNQSLKVK